jgi:hypothetical protein
LKQKRHRISQRNKTMMFLISQLETNDIFDFTTYKNDVLISQLATNKHHTSQIATNMHHTLQIATNMRRIPKLVSPCS